MSRGFEVVIAGGGVAGAATAVRLRSLGASVRVLVRDRPPAPGIEAVPAAGLALLDVLGESGVRADLEAVEVDGPAHRWDGRTGSVPHPFVHLDRTRLADVLLRRAVARGAAVERVTRLPPARVLESGADALVDATGRAAAWSRPVHHDSHQVAWQFRSPPGDDLGGRVVQGDGWWAYRLGHPSATWAGVVTSSTESLSSGMRRTALGRLGLDTASARAMGRRPAGIQRADRPVDGRRVAVGDAALAHDPLAGQGIRFALASAIAAATTIANWAGAEAGSGELASTYYTDLVQAEHTRHLAAVTSLTAGRPAYDSADSLPPVLVFGAPLVEVPLAVDGRIELGPAIGLPGGGTTRWASSFDLLELARMASEPIPRLVLTTLLQEAGLTAPAARSLLHWAVRNGVLVAATLGPQGPDGA